MTSHDLLDIQPEVATALAEGTAVVALESTITTHGLPRPDNLEAARMSEAAVRESGAVPATVAVRDLDAMLDFYCGVLGFAVTNRGIVGDGAEMAFISQDPTEHHQMVFVSGLPRPEHQFVMADHMAFRTGTLDDLRAIGDRLEADALAWIWPSVTDLEIRVEIQRAIANAAVETPSGAAFATGYTEADYVIAQSDRKVDGIVLDALAQI